MYKRALLVAMLALATRMPGASAQSHQEIEDALKAKYEGKVLTLRNFSMSNQLKYSPEGVPTTAEQQGSWTLYGIIEVQRVALKDDHLEISGIRRAVIYDQKQKALSQGRTRMQVEVDVALPQGQIDESSLEQTMAKVFLTSTQKLADIVPSFWKPYLLGEVASSPGKRAEEDLSNAPGENKGLGEEAYHVGIHVTAPKLIHKAEPKYTNEAKAVRLQGTLVLTLIVQRDGTSRDLAIKTPLGLGLDEAAIEAVRQWRFLPGKKDGEPVDVFATVEVTFKM